MIRLLLLILVIFCVNILYSQNTSNYVFSTSTDASLSDMSSGTTLLVSPNTDGLNTGIFSNTNDIGFTFYFMSMPYDKFVVTEDGVMRLGTSLAAINRTPEINVSEPRLVPFSCDMATGSNGKVHYKTTGVSPNRVCIVEWKNCYGTFPNAMPVIGNLTFQIRLYEATGVIEYVYGYMYFSRRRDASDTGEIGFGSSNASDKVIYKITSFSSTNISTTVPLPGTPTLWTLITAVGEISGLSSSTDGARRIYTFTPPAAPADPTNLSYSGITYSSMTLHWDDNATNETHYHLYRSDDGGVNYELALNLPANTITSGPISGLPDKTYHWKIYAVNEGNRSNPLEGNCSTQSAGTIYSTAAGGLWSQTTTWAGGVLPGVNDDVFIRDGATVTIDVTTAVCNNLTIGEGVSGHLQFIAGAGNATLTCDGDAWVKTGATFDVVAGASGGSRKLILGQRFYSNSNLKVDGTFDMNNTSPSVADVEFKGVVDGTISGTGAVCEFYSITVNKGSNNEKCIEPVRVITIDSPSALGKRLTINNGTFKLSSASTLTPYYGAQTICGANGRLWINDPAGSVQCVGTGTVSGAGNATIDGKLQVTSGIFGYGSGNNTMQINGTLEIDGPNGFVNSFGRVNFGAAAYLNFYDGNLVIDPQAGNNLAAGRAFEVTTTTFVFFTGGTLTVIDPNANAGSSEFYIPGSEQNKVLNGATLRFGNGVSSTVGSANGFTIATPGGYQLNIGNVIVNNPAGANRNVRMTTTSAGTPTIENLTITAGTFDLNAVAVNVSGDAGIINNGTLQGTAANSRINFNGTAAQSYSGAGVLNTTNLTLQINNSAGVTLQSPFSTLALILTSGLLNTSVANLISVTGTAVANISGYTASSYVNGPLARNLISGAGTWVFPVGKSGYTFFEILNPTTTGTVMIQAEVFDADCGGNIINPPGYELNTSRYWRAQAIGGATFTNGTFRINETNPTTNLILTNCATVNGTYTSIHASQAGNTITSLAATAGLNYYCAAAPAFLSGTYLVGTGQPFLSLTENTANGFFFAVNNSGLRGDVTLVVTSNLTETGAVALNQWAEINGTGHKIRIVPQDAILKNITGNVGTNFGMIRLNGADRICFDGSFGGTGRYLLFRNTNTGYCVFGLINEATYDTLTNLIIETGNTSTDNSRRGAVLFGTSSAGTTGNSYNVISNCQLRDRTDVAGVPHTLIYSFGTAARLNKGIIISENSLFNFTNEGITINVTGSGGDWIIQDNHFYQTASRNVAQTAINIGTGTNQLISGNFIGGQTENCGGGAWTNTGNFAVKGIVISSSTGDPASIQGNTIQNFSLTGGTGSFTGIEATAGPCNIGTVTGNTIGHSSTANSIAIAGNTVNSGIKSSSTSSVSIWNNTVANITCSAANTTNTLVGIWQSGTGSGNISSNTVHSLSSASTKVNIDAMPLQGIYHGGASTGSSFITGNTIYNLALTNNGNNQIYVAGISVTSVTNPIINKNKIWGLTNASTRITALSPPAASGITVYRPAAGSTVEIRNNMVSLGEGQTTNTEFNGIWLQSSTNAYTANCNYNTISISGTVTAGALNSFAILRGDNSTISAEVTVVFKNNIFANSRTGGTGIHYAVGNQGTTPATNWAAGSTNYNFYVGSAATSICLWNAANCNISSYRTNTGGDGSSWSAISTTGASDYQNINTANLFTNLANGDLHIIANQPEAWFVNGKGVQHTLNDDIDFDSRSTSVIAGSTDIGADEFIPTSIPIPAGQTGSISSGSSSSYVFANRTLSTISWDGSNLPAAITLRYYTQQNPDPNDGFGTPYPNLVGSQYSNCVWDITPTGGNINNYTYDFKLFYDDALLGTIDDILAMKTAKNPYRYPTAADPLVDDYGVYLGTLDDPANSYEISDVVDFSKFILYNGPAVTLPINLVSFNAIPEEEDVVLEWVTSSEINNDYFTIEKSIDGLNFFAVTQIKGAGFSNQILSYKAIDEDAFINSNILYYRLRQTDFDGKFTLSNTISIRKTDNNQKNFLLFPNPVAQGQTSYIQAEGFEPGKELLVVVLNILGQEQYSKVIITNDDGTILEAIDSSNKLSAGTYIIIGSSNDSIFKRKLIVR